jgi:hypothetical protein
VGVGVFFGTWIPATPTWKFENSKNFFESNRVFDFCATEVSDVQYRSVEYEIQIVKFYSVTSFFIKTPTKIKPKLEINWEKKKIFNLSVLQNRDSYPRAIIPTVGNAVLNDLKQL